MSILDRIDDVLDDWHGSDDSMRWRPGPDGTGDGDPTYLEILEQQCGVTLLPWQREWAAASFAPAGTDPRDDAQFTTLGSMVMSARRSGRAAEFARLVQQAATRGEHVHYLHGGQSNCLTGECTPTHGVPVLLPEVPDLNRVTVNRPCSEPGCLICDYTIRRDALGWPPQILGFADQMQQIATSTAESPASIDRLRRGVLAMAETAPDTLTVTFTADNSRALAAIRQAQEEAARLVETIAARMRADHAWRLAQVYRRAWSGPSRYERMIARGFGVGIDLVFPRKPSVLDARHHRRYRNRKGRR